MTYQSQILLEWYDQNARELPWRVKPEVRKKGVAPDPYRVWLSEVMLQQTTVAAVKAYFIRFLDLWPTVADLAYAPDADVMAEWAGLGYYARARNLLKCARKIRDDYDSVFPSDHETLLSLPGIGPYTAAAISAIAFDRPETVMDGNVERVMARLFNDATPLPDAKPIFYQYASMLTPGNRPGDYAQAVMDLGATICKPRAPLCDICPWRSLCKANEAGTANTLPNKRRKKPKPTRRGTIYVGRTMAGEWMLERRPSNGLLGGMLGWPGPPWAERETAQLNPPINAEWKRAKGQVKHTFTHFHLILDVFYADQIAQKSSNQPGLDNQALICVSEFRSADLPTVMQKVFEITKPYFDKTL